MDDSSFPTQSVVSTHTLDGPVDVADCPIDFDFAYPSLKSDLSNLEFALEFAMALLNPLVHTRALSCVLRVILLFGSCNDPSLLHYETRANFITIVEDRF